jgi:hypothetical protein
MVPGGALRLAARLFKRIASLFQSLSHSSLGGLRTVLNRFAGSFSAMFDCLPGFGRGLFDGFAGFFHRILFLSLRGQTEAK